MKWKASSNGRQSSHHRRRSPLQSPLMSNPQGAAPARRRMTLYSRVGCHLCHDAEQLLQKAIASHPGFEIDVVDVDSSPNLKQRYSDQVPVLVVDGREVLSGRFTSFEVDAALTAESMVRPAKAVLAQKRCVPCEGGVPTLNRDEQDRLLEQLDGGWEIIDRHHLSKEFRFPNWVRALWFTTQIGDVAEAEGHHPDIRLSYGKVLVDVWTHAIGGLSENDFVLAAKVDAILDPTLKV